MNKTRILGGFSLVEMMLLLLVTSLMLASSVTLITKKHVKVPKIAMHGAYICYEKNGRLHEEQYVGSGLRRKTRDQDVAACSFRPPARTAYLHIQAIGGGGGGGDSGYTGGKIETFKSATEVISPFGITQGLLDLKGISGQELKNLGGTVYAYANASGDLGDAGRGGDLYYIAKDCGTGSCLVNRSWKYNGSSERQCSCNSGSVSYTQQTCKYDYSCKDPCTGYYCDVCDRYEYVACSGTSCSTCSEYNDEFCSGTGCRTCSEYNDVACSGYYCATCSEYYDVSCSGPTCEVCTKYKEGSTTICIEGTNKSKTNCKTGTKKSTTDCKTGTKKSTTNCKKGTKKTSNCLNGYDWVTCTSSCTKYLNIPYDAECSKSNYQNLTVNTTDTYAQDTSKNPPYRIITKNATITSADAKKERFVKRDKEIAKEICNYGNPDKFTGVSDGVFGTFAQGEVSVGCDTGSIRNAFGEDIFPMGGGNTVITKVETQSSSSVYNSKIEYDRSEETDISGYGETCTNKADGSCSTNNKYDNSFSNPVNGTYYPTYKSLATGCSYNSRQNYYTKDDTSGCDGKSNVRNCSDVWPSPSKNVVKSCSCVQDNSSGTECLYSYGNANTTGVCMYIPAKSTGGNAGTGTKCKTKEIEAGLGLNYLGNSTVIPGIRGSDINCTGAGYKALYTEAEYNRQPSCYAQNGTDSFGNASVSITGSASTSCTANNVTPLQGKGARKTSTGATTGTNGANSIRNGSLTTTGGASSGDGCGNQHVGYCLKNRENGKYTYWYTWDTNYLQYGEGGKAGQYRAMIIRSFDGRELPITLGRGGAGGANATGNAGADGGTTIVGNIVQAGGGAGGAGGKLTPTEQLPIWHAGGAFEKGKNGTQGESANISNFKANILNLILPIDNSVLGQWLAASGAGGDGGGSRNNCWASEWYREFEGVEVIGKGRVHAEDVLCRKPEPYWSATPNATSGISGAVLIRW